MCVYIYTHTPLCELSVYWYIQRIHIRTYLSILFFDNNDIHASLFALRLCLGTCYFTPTLPIKACIWNSILKLYNATLENNRCHQSPNPCLPSHLDMESRPWSWSNIVAEFDNDLTLIQGWTLGWFI